MKQKFTVSWTGEGGFSRLDFVEAEPDHNSIMEAAAQCLINDTEYNDAEDVPTPGDILALTYETPFIFDGWIKESSVKTGEYTPAVIKANSSENMGLMEQLLNCPDISHARIISPEHRVPEVVVPTTLRDKVADRLASLEMTLKEAKLQLEYLDEKFQPTGTTSAMIARINHILTDKEKPK